jgi:hypothetical protein
MRKLLLCLVFCSAFFVSPFAQTIRAVYFNPKGTDDGREYVEIEHTANTTLTDIWLVSIDGDASEAGKVDIALNLSSYTTGSNGLLLIRDGSTALEPPPASATTIVINNFTPDLENGTATYLLVTNFTGSIDQDLDDNNDGTLNTTLPWATALFGISQKDNDVDDKQYADDIGGVNMPDITGTGNEAEAIAFYDNTWYSIVIATGGPTNGPFTLQNAWNSAGTTSIPASVLWPGGVTSLPIELAYFKATPDKSGIDLNWQTLSEKNNEWFVIERSRNALQFEEIGQIRGAGHSLRPQDYRFRDAQPASGMNYYRLRQIDFNGVYSYSPVATALFRSNEDILVNIYPNAQNLRVVLTNAPEADVQWIVSDMSGRILQQGISHAVAGEFTVPFNMPSLGTYQFTIFSTFGRWQLPFQILE